MKRLKKIFRRIGLILLIILASVGVGIAGGVPLTPAQRRNESAEIRIELVESKDNENDEEWIQQKVKE